MRNTADVTDGKPIAILLQSISGVSAINPLVAFYDIHGGKREVLFFYFVPDTTRNTVISYLITSQESENDCFNLHWKLPTKAILLSRGFTHAGLARMRKISRCESYAVSSFSFLRIAWCCRQSLVQYVACAPYGSKMGTEVEGTLMHANGPHWGNTPHCAPHPACVYNALQ
jgi:hypothetical protein